ncbi:MAG: hypothetical protein ABFS17_04855 [Chloroflexota bacterium]
MKRIRRPEWFDQWVDLVGGIGGWWVFGWIWLRKIMVKEKSI